MRGIKNKTLIMGFACVAFCLSSLTSKAQQHEIINMAGAVWSYQSDPAVNLDGTAWNQPVYPEADAWPTGSALFGLESVAYPLAFNTPLPPLNTAGTGARTDYFRTTFNWNNEVTVDPFLVGVAHVDDGFIAYLNGVEIHRYNMPADPITRDTAASSANPGGEPVTYNFSIQVSTLPTPLIVGQNLLAVELHQAGTTSSDKVWGLQADIVSVSAPAFTVPAADENRLVLEFTSTDLTVEANGFPLPTFQWQVSTDGGATYTDLPETSATYTIASMSVADVGMYRAVATNTEGSDTSPVFNVQLDPDVTAPTLVSSTTDIIPGDIGTVTLVFDEAMAIGHAENTANYVVDIAGGGTLTVDSAALQPNGTDVVLTLVPTIGVGYTLTIFGLTDIAATPNTITTIVIDPLTFPFDTTAPMLLSACSENGGNDVRLVFNEDITINGDSILYQILNVDDPFTLARGSTARVVDGNTLLLQGMVDLFIGGALPLVDGETYRLELIDADPPSVADLFGNKLAPNAISAIFDPQPSHNAPVSPTVVFQEGLNGYVGTLDTEIRGNIPDQDGSEITVLNPDGNDGGFPVNGLWRFENAIGNGVGQVPPGSTIVSATLELTTTGGGQGSAQGLHRMLLPWQETASWNTLGMDNGTAGLQADDIEATVADSGIFTPTSGTVESFDVAADVQAWVNGDAPNYGWVAIPQPGSTDGWDVNSSEAADAAVRPLLRICYTVVSCDTAPSISTQPMGATVEEGDFITLSVLALCGETFQWQRNGVNVPGGVSSSLTFASVKPGDAGDYTVTVGNSIDSVTSTVATLVVRPDGEPPVLESISADGTAGTISLSFNEALAAGTAGNTANYTIAIVGGGTLAVDSAVLENGSDVTLSAALNSNQRYILTISGLSDVAQTPNVIDPIVIDPLVVEYLIVDWDASWSYTTNSADAPVPGWEAPAFDEANWLTGPGLFGLETSAGTPIPNPPGIQTPFTLMDEAGGWLWTFYFRTTVNNSIAPADDVVFNFRHLIDDGAVFYVGGVEAARFNMSVTNSPAPVAYTNAADDAGEAALTDTAVALALGDNDIAVEVHQGNEGSSDVLFGTQIVAVVGAKADVSANLRISQDATSVTVEWDDPTLPLLASPTVDGTFTEVVGATSPYVIAKPLAPSMQFFGLGEAP